MKIIHIITGLNDGGAEAVLFRLCTQDNVGLHQVVSLMDVGKYGPLLHAKNIEVNCLEMPSGRLTVAGLWCLWKLLRKERPDVVQTWMYHANLIGGVIAYMANTRNVFWGIHHTTLDPKHTKHTTVIVNKLCAKMSRWMPTAIICCAKKSLQIHRAVGYHGDKLHFIPNGYDLDKFKPDDEMRDLLRSEWSVGTMTLIGMVGRFDPLKDHHNLLVALASVKKAGNLFRCVLAGRGMDSKNAELCGFLTELNLHNEVVLLGQRDDVPGVMSALDIHVLSSCSEAFPNVLAEAMACGTPCVTTDVGDAAEIVGITGWVVPPSDSPALAAALVNAIEISKNKDAWLERRIAARKRIVKNFSIKKMIAEYHSLWSGEAS